MLRLMRIQRRRGTRRFHATETAPSGAGVAHKHDSGRSSILIVSTPAVADIGAARFFADGVQVQAPKIGFYFFVIGIGGRDGGLQPGWEAGVFAFAA